MSASQCMHTTFQRGDEFIHRTGIVARLGQQPTDQRQYVADPVVQLCNQQFLLFMCLLPFLVGGIGQAQHHFQQGRPQCLRDAQLGRGERHRRTLHQLRPFLKTLARSQARPIRPIFDMLFLIARPAHRTHLLSPEQHDIIARSPW